VFGNGGVRRFDWRFFFFFDDTVNSHELAATIFEVESSQAGAPPLPTPTHVFHSLNAWIGGRNSTFPCCLTVELNICLKQQPTKNTKKIRRAVKRRDGKETSNGASERASERRRMGAAHCAAHAPVHFAPAREPAPLFC
jgi:hypothetical protein